MSMSFDVDRVNDSIVYLLNPSSSSSILRFPKYGISPNSDMFVLKDSTSISQFAERNRFLKQHSRLFSSPIMDDREDKKMVLSREYHEQLRKTKDITYQMFGVSLSFIGLYILYKLLKKS